MHGVAVCAAIGMLVGICAIAFADEAAVLKDVMYGKSDNEMQVLDAYLAKSDSPTPVLIEFHGGGWWAGDKTNSPGYSAIHDKALGEGISVVRANYRLTPKAWYPAQVRDAARVVQFVKSKGKEWNIDRERVALIGGSAGAHLSAWVALHDDLADPGSADPVERISSRVRCFFDCWGPMDLTRMEMPPGDGTRGGRLPRNPMFAMFHVTREEYELPWVEELVGEASPISYVSRDDPPVFMIYNGPAGLTGLDDPKATGGYGGHAYMHGLLLEKKMKEAGCEVERHIAPDIKERRDYYDDLMIKFMKRQFGMEAGAEREKKAE